METRIHIVCGPTASGKSARALAIAQEKPAVIINADAIQVYRQLRIVTARPDAQEEQRAPHALYGVLSAAEACSVARWLALATAEIEAAWARGALPLVVGGTGMYLKALMEGINDIPDVPLVLRDEAERLYAKQGAQVLRQHDPAMAEKLNPGDTQRQVRALSVMLATGKSLAYWQEQPTQAPLPQAEFSVEQLLPEREQLYAQCDARFLKMLEQGALEEVKQLQAMELPRNLPAMRAVGVPELLGYLEGEWDLENAIRRAQQATRNYAKRQLTWFRNQL